MPNSEHRDAVCFTAGAPGAFFSAGVIHAHMAADRRTPLVVAGISTGAISAALMQRVYRDFLAVKDARHDDFTLEAARWKTIRNYITL